jgi:potassium-dependent mechanosensitive channel
MANASGRAEAPTAPQPSTLPATRALDELPGSDELGKLQAALAQIKENLERRNLTAAELQGLREQIAPLSDSILAALQRLEPRLAGIKERLDQLGPKPDAKAPPESPGVAAERASQQKNYSDISEVVKRARLLAAEAEQTRTSIDAEDLDKLQAALAQKKASNAAIWRLPNSTACANKSIRSRI